MTSERWQRVKDVCQRALEREPRARGAFLAELCQGDYELQRDVEALLMQATEGEGILERPVWQKLGLALPPTVGHPHAPGARSLPGTASGRGIPRRSLRKFNERVRWTDKRAQLAFSRDDVSQFRFFADLYDVLISREQLLLGELRADRECLGLYYLVDWILLRGADEFTLTDAVAASRRLSHLIALVDEAAPDIIGRLLGLLVDRKYLEVVKLSAEARAAQAVADESPMRYRLTHQRLVEMGSLAGVVEQEAQDVVNEILERRDAPSRLPDHETQSRDAEEGRTRKQVLEMPVARESLVDDTGMVYELRLPTTTIGRRDTNDIQIVRTEVSRFHAEITRTPGGWVLTDQNSRYGTFLNDTSLTAPVPLRHGDTIRLGRSQAVTLVFHARPTAAAAPQGPNNVSNQRS
jgi:hypothetical protein